MNSSLWTFGTNPLTPTQPNQQVPDHLSSATCLRLSNVNAEAKDCVFTATSRLNYIHERIRLNKFNFSINLICCSYQTIINLANFFL